VATGIRADWDRGPSHRARDQPLPWSASLPGGSRRPNWSASGGGGRYQISARRRRVIGAPVRDPATSPSRRWADTARQTGLRLALLAFQIGDLRRSRSRRDDCCPPATRPAHSAQRHPWNSGLCRLGQPAV